MQAPQRRQEVIDELTMRIERNDVKGSGFIQFPPQRPFSDKLEQQPPTLSHQANPELYQHSSSYSAAPRPNGSGGRGAAPRPQQLPYASAQQPRPAAGAQFRPPSTGTQYRPPPQQAVQNPYRPQNPASSRTPQQPDGGRPRPQQQAANGYADSHSQSLGAVGQHGTHGPGRGSYAPNSGRGSTGGGARAGRADANGRGRGGFTPDRGNMPQSAYSAADVQPLRPAAVASQPRAPAPTVVARPAHAPPTAQPRAPPTDDSSEQDQKLSKSQLKRLMKKKREGKA